MNGVDGELEWEIEALISEAVGRFGVAGRVRIEAGTVLLEGSGPTSRASLGALLEQWDMLAPDLRRRRCNDLARQLVGERRAAVASSGPKRRWAVLGRIAPLLVLAAGAALVYCAYRMLAPHATNPAAASPSEAGTQTLGAVLQDDHERAERALSVCNETLARVARGASLGPTDVEGWVVEITLLRDGDTPPLELDPGLAAFVDRRPGHTSESFAWPGTPGLVALDGPMTHVVVTGAGLPAANGMRFQGVTLTFSGRYVTPYLTRNRRGAYQKTAAALFTRLGARYGGLYARCAGGTTHHIGSWFRGPGPGGAAAALVYFMGTYARVRSDVPAGNGLPDRAVALERIAKATSTLDKRRVALLVGDSGGTIAGRPDGPVTLGFPFSEANRAARAGEAIAVAVGLSR